VSELTQLEKGVFVLNTALKSMTLLPGVYRMISISGEILYIGKAKNLKKRVVSYTRPEILPIRLQRMIAQIHRVEITITQTELEALLLESNLIKKHKPKYNILLKDDKSYPYIHITGDQDFPKAVKYRGARNKQGEYFGPFANAGAVDEAILSLQRIFMIRNCSESTFKNRKRPCLQYHIKRCSAPCVNKVSKDEYASSIQQAKNFLKGKTTVVQDMFSKKMMTASDAQDFETAAKFRDRIKLMSELQSKQLINVSGINDADIIALHEDGGQRVVQILFFRNDRNYGTETIMLKHTEGESLEDCMAAFLNQFYTNKEPASLLLLNHEPSDFQLIKNVFKEKYKSSLKWEFPKSGVKNDLIHYALKNAADSLKRKEQESDSMNKILKELVTIFDLKKTPQRIEVYDNSHIQGSFPVGCMIVATPDGFDKKSYRKFKIKKERGFGGDDFAMMEEVLERRFNHEKDWGLPDLLLIDGGKGQLTSVNKALQKAQLNIPVVCIAKGEDRHAGKEFLIMHEKEPFQLEFNSKLLYFLQRLRDEAHRFAITTHRSARVKNIAKSKIDDLPGIGSLRKKALLQHFGSVEFIKQASIKELILVKGISYPLAKSIYEYFQDNR